MLDVWTVAQMQVRLQSHERGRGNTDPEYPDHREASRTFKTLESTIKVLRGLKEVLQRVSHRGFGSRGCELCY